MYLILHKVRGEPAFDIAEQMEVGDEAWWIIPTSGHRAYPVDYWPLEQAAPLTKACRVPDNFANWPDHYEVSSPPPKDFNIIGMVMQAFGKPIKRRI